MKVSLSLSSLSLLLVWMPQHICGFSAVNKNVAVKKNTALFSATEPQLAAPGTAELDKPWTELGFEFRPTNSHLRMTFRNGEWGPTELVKDPYINLHIGATALHYGQACFEGLKAFCHEDNSVHIFRPDENAKRLQSSCERIMMPFPSKDEFLEACANVVRDNVAYVPPYGSGGALYLRPLLFGSGPRIGLQPADEYTFIIMVIPVGDYYKGGLAAPVDGMIIRNFDRAAPRGVGNVKVAGNYAADLLPNQTSKKNGYPIGLYLDAATQTMVEEFSTSNFVGVDNTNKKYVTPYSQRSVLPSITNKSLMTLAEQELGYKVEQRDIPLSELATFDEVVACGTAVVVTPVGSLTDIHADGQETKYTFGTEVGTTTRQLFDLVRAIQFGDAEDKNNWNYKVC
jgi:branched-chain amino acid aminotransferase